MPPTSSPSGSRVRCPSSAACPVSWGDHAVYAADDTVTAINIFNKVEEAEELNRRALASIQKNLAPFVVGQATATAGPVIVHSVP